MREPETKQLLRALTRLATYQNAPELMSAGATLKQIGLALTGGVLYLDGDWQTIADGLRAAAENAGVQILSQTSVVAVTTNEDGCTVQSTSGAEYQASFVILAVAPRTAAQLVNDGRDAALNKQAQESIPVKAACLDVALRGLPDPGALFALGMDQAIYFSVHSAAARLAPPAGGAVVHLMKYLRHDQPHDHELDRLELEELFDLVQPGWRERVIFERFLPQMIVSNQLVTAESGGTAGRISPSVPDQARLFVAGDWVGAEGLLADAALSSAKQAAELVIKAARDVQHRPSDAEAERGAGSVESYQSL